MSGGAAAEPAEEMPRDRNQSVVPRGNGTDSIGVVGVAQHLEPCICNDANWAPTGLDNNGLYVFNGPGSKGASREGAQVEAVSHGARPATIGRFP